MAEFHNRIIGRYICNNEKLLGKGLMCTVYEAKDIDTNKYVALKQIQKIPNSGSRVSAQKLKQSYDLEIEILKKCKKLAHNNNVITLLDNFETQDNYNIVLELCESNLKEYLEKNDNKRLKEQEAVDILIQIVEGEKCLHQINYCHRDIKPENILIKKGCVKITDVNLAKYLENLNFQETCSFVGTPFYIAPEVSSKGIYSPYKADIYSLGIVLYEMLYGLLNKQEEKIEIRKIIQSKQIKINPILENLILKMIDIDPQNRADWCYVSSCLYQYSISDKPLIKSQSIQVITSFYNNAWQEEFYFFNQIIQDYSQLSIKEQNIFLSPSAFLIIKLIYKLVEEKILQLLKENEILQKNNDKNQQNLEAQSKQLASLNENLMLLSQYQRQYLKEAKYWYIGQLNDQNQILCQSDDLKDEFRYKERSKNFAKHFQCYLADFFNQLNSIRCESEELEQKKKHLQLKLLIACDKNNDFLQVQEQLRKSQLYKDQNIVGFCQNLKNPEEIKQYIEALQPMVTKILHDQ
ncbi:unnamed protein product [Paramecium sonneborni]|uniref:Protein kinase domain-containing protein n=1 Tax=Paramecium sonneborni TaxID=65129 RepID=A0A8S1M144_9CILI|nr:unnamed protein product [Paramecium sonneborni]